ncbi:MAG: hypothetical protein GX785_02195 [Armatimonadetes bacterium]|nr:hypothetical protein [Armatimonadota bacterium]
MDEDRLIRETLESAKLPPRMKVFLALATRERSVAQVAALVGHGTTATGRLLSRMVGADQLTDRWEGKQHLYSIADPDLRRWSYRHLRELVGSGGCTDLGEMGERILGHLLDYDRNAAQEDLHLLLLAGHPPEEIYEHTITPMMERVGTLWEAGQVSVAQEHFVSAQVETALSVLFWLLAPAPADDAPAACVCAVPGNVHNIGPRILHHYLTTDGWKVLFLDGMTPLEDLVRLVGERRTRLVGLSVATDDQLPITVQSVATLRAMHRPPEAIFVGGPLIRSRPDLAGQIEADAVPGTAREARDLARQYQTAD